MNAPLTLKTRKCKYCPVRFPLFRSTQVVCSPACAQKHAEAKRVKDEKAARRETKAKLEAIKPRSKWLKEVQSVFNNYIRLRDELKPCISCGRHHRGQYHAGHYLSVGSTPELRFEESNVHKQCSACNNYKSGNAVRYRVRLIKKIGLEKVEWLEGPHEPKHYSIDDLKQLKAHYQQECKRLIKEQS